MAVVASSSAATVRKYDVFLSFRGEDTRASFTSHLHSRLCQKGIETYVDERLEKGSEISPALLRSIEESKISVVIFSENYAFSSWCLDELLHILECKKTYGQIVVPVFYNIDPSHIRNQPDNYAAAFARLEERFQDKVQGWKAALKEASNITGWHSRLYRHDSEFVETIVKDILKKLNRLSSISDDFKDLIGIDKSVKHIESLMFIDTHNVKIIGIWGMGGIGKTTLARVIFNRLSSQFDGCCFLTNVIERFENRGMNDFMTKLYTELLGENYQNTGNTYFKLRLRHKKVLIVLDDLNDPDQLEVLSGDLDQFGAGSRIIVTTRDAQVLRDRADESYELKGLNFGEAIQLFSLNAFKRSSPTIDDMKQLVKVVNYADGVPLALKVLGSFLRSRKKENWESELNKLKKVPNKKIHNVLRLSYDGLDMLEKSIFLDIVCFFKEMYCRHEVESVLGGRDSFVHIGIDNLIDKSLITVDEHNRFQMHALIQEMGWEIIRLQSIEEPGNRSRLRFAKDVYHVFKNNTGTQTIEGIHLNLNIDHGFNSEVRLSPTIFKRMFNLRLLIMFGGESNKIQFPQGLEYLPDTLKSLTWFGCPLRSFPSEFTPHNLVKLWIYSSQLEQLWDGVQNLENLKHFHLGCKKLIKIPDLSRAPNLETLSIYNCTSLCQASSLLRFRKFEKRTSFDPSYCTCNLDDYAPEWIPGHLSLSGCYNLEILPEIFGGVRALHLGSTSIKELPSSVWSLDSLERLDLSFCELLENLPSGIRQLKSLKHLNLRGCISIERLPELPRNIITLDLSETLIEQVPSTFIELCLSTLEELHLNACTELKSLPTNIYKLKSLKHLKLSGCENLESFPEIVEPMAHLEILNLRETGVRVLHPSINNLLGLVDLILERCNNLVSIPDISSLNRLQRISLSGCPRLENVPPLPDGLRTLNLAHMGYCNISKVSDGMGYFSSLEVLDLRGHILYEIPISIKRLSSLIKLHICDCKNLKSLPELPDFLEFLDATGCTSLETIVNPRAASGFTIVREYLFYNCLNLDQKARSGIIIEFQNQTLRTAVAFLVNLAQIHQDSDDPRVSISCPGSKIPKWFTYQSRGSSINIKLPPHWHNDYFMGFAFCVVVGFDGFHFDGKNLRLDSHMHFKTGSGESHYFFNRFSHYRRGDVLVKGNTIFNSSHWFMWYRFQNYYGSIDAEEVSIFFDIKVCEWERPIGHFEINKCGIRLLYFQDGEELYEQYKLFTSSDANKEPEPSGSGTPNIDSDEPQFHKRTKW